MAWSLYTLVCVYIFARLGTSIYKKNFPFINYKFLQKSIQPRNQLTWLCYYNCSYQVESQQKGTHGFEAQLIAMESHGAMGVTQFWRDMSRIQDENKRNKWTTILFSFPNNCLLVEAGKQAPHVLERIYRF